jgi:hypothetical protein
MCQFLQINYGCGHQALSVTPSGTVFCESAYQFWLKAGRDGPPAGCFPLREDVTDPGFIQHSYRYAGKCPRCRGSTGGTSGIVFALDGDSGDEGVEPEMVGGESDAQVTVPRPTSWQGLTRGVKPYKVVAKVKSQIRGAMSLGQVGLAQRRGHSALSVKIYPATIDASLPQVEHKALSPSEDADMAKIRQRFLMPVQRTVTTEQMSVNVASMMMQPVEHQPQGSRRVGASVVSFCFEAVCACCVGACSVGLSALLDLL